MKANQRAAERKRKAEMLAEWNVIGTRFDLLPGGESPTISPHTVRSITLPLAPHCEILIPPALYSHQFAETADRVYRL